MTDKSEKKFAAVKMMREIRDKLSQRYLEEPSRQDEDLAQIRKKYGIKSKDLVKADWDPRH